MSNQFKNPVNFPIDASHNSYKTAVNQISNSVQILFVNMYFRK